MSTLLPFHKDIIQEICDPRKSDLLVVARGLGLRRIVCSLMQIYDSPKSLVLLVNASPEEETAIGEENWVSRAVDGLDCASWGTRHLVRTGEIHCSLLYCELNKGPDRLCIRVVVSLW